MLRIKHVFIILLLLILVMINISSMSYATAVTVTDSNLNTALQKFVSSDSNKDNYKISVSNNIITITSDKGTYTLNYDLSGKPTFIYEANISQGMSYADFEKKTDNLSIVMLGYLAVANIQGVEYEDSAAYFAKNLLQAAFSRLSSANTSNSYTIYDDTNMSDGVTIEKDPSDTRTIYASEFGDHVMEYVNAMYGEKTSYKDTEGFNTFEWTTERQDVTTTSCRLVSTMIVNLDADFSKLKGYSGAITDSFMNGDITEQNADYLIKLKVGQKCNIVSSEKIVGYETSGSSCIEFNRDKTVITATAVGKANGYIYVGDSNTKKSIYVIVEANTENQTLNPISIKIDTASNSNPSNVDITKTDNSKTDEVKADTSNTKTTANTDTKDDSTISATTLPKTGTSETIVVIGISICMILAIIFAIKNKKYKDIK